MKALRRLPPVQGIAAMQSINSVVINPVFLAAFFGTALSSLAVLIGSISSWDDPSFAFLLAGGLLYLVGSFFVTIVFNVPRNNALAAIDPESAKSAAVWTDYLKSWTAWNHVRTIASLGAALFFTIAIGWAT
jgi:uncharacterized membrane protein